MPDHSPLLGSSPLSPSGPRRSPAPGSADSLGADNVPAQSDHPTTEHLRVPGDDFDMVELSEIGIPDATRSAPPGDNSVLIEETQSPVAGPVPMAVIASGPGASPRTPRVDPRLGSRLGKFAITQLLGRGAMGVVYLAQDTMLRRKVAVKFLSDETLAQDPMAAERFLVEGRAAAGIQHANVVAVYEAGQDGDAPYTVMELVTGGSVDGLVRKSPGGRLPPGEATRIVWEAANGLRAAHAAGVLHRDIKPANLMLAADGTVKVADFGLAKPQDSGASMSATGTVVGTPFYMAPEQCRGERVDHRADIYSLGATYFRLLCGRPPFVAASSPEVMYKQCFEPLADVSAEFPDVPPPCWAVITKAMAKDRQARYANLDEFLTDLTGPGMPMSSTATSASRLAMRSRAGGDSLSGELSADVGQSATMLSATRRQLARVTANRWVGYASIFSVGAAVALAAMGLYWITNNGSDAPPQEALGETGFGRLREWTIPAQTTGVLTLTVPDSAVGGRLSVRLVMAGLGAASPNDASKTSSSAAGRPTPASDDQTGSPLNFEWHDPQGAVVFAKENCPPGELLRDGALRVAGSHQLLLRNTAAEALTVTLAVSDQAVVGAGTVAIPLGHCAAVVNAVARGSGPSGVSVLPGGLGIDEYQFLGRVGEVYAVFAVPRRSPNAADTPAEDDELSSWTDTQPPPAGPQVDCLNIEGRSAPEITAPDLNGRLFRIDRDGLHRLRLEWTGPSPLPYELRIRRLLGASPSSLVASETLRELPVDSLPQRATVTAEAAPLTFRVVVPREKLTPSRGGPPQVATTTVLTTAADVRFQLMDRQGRLVNATRLAVNSQTSSLAFWDTPISGRRANHSFYAVVDRGDTPTQTAAPDTPNAASSPSADAQSPTKPAEITVRAGLSAEVKNLEPFRDALTLSQSGRVGGVTLPTHGAPGVYVLSEPPPGLELAVTSQADYVELLSADGQILSASTNQAQDPDAWNADPPTGENDTREDSLPPRPWTARLGLGRRPGPGEPTWRVLRLRAYPTRRAVPIDLRLEWVRPRGEPLPNDWLRPLAAGERRGWLREGLRPPPGRSDLRLSFQLSETQAKGRLSVRLWPPAAAMFAQLIGPDGQNLQPPLAETSGGWLSDMALRQAGQYDLVVPCHDDWPGPTGQTLSVDLCRTDDDTLEAVRIGPGAGANHDDIVLRHPGHVRELIFEPAGPGMQSWMIAADEALRANVWSVDQTSGARDSRVAIPPVRKPQKREGQWLWEYVLPRPGPLRLRLRCQSPQPTDRPLTIQVEPLSTGDIEPLEPATAWPSRDSPVKNLLPPEFTWAWRLRAKTPEADRQFRLALISSRADLQLALIRPDGSRDPSRVNWRAEPSASREGWHVWEAVIDASPAGDYTLTATNTDTQPAQVYVVCSRPLRRSTPPPGATPLSPAADLPAQIAELRFAHFADVQELAWPVRRDQYALVAVHSPLDVRGLVSQPIEIECLDSQGKSLSRGQTLTMAKHPWPVQGQAEGLGRLRLRPTRLPEGGPTAPYSPVQVLVLQPAAAPASQLTVDERPLDGKLDTAEPGQTPRAAHFRLTLDENQARAGLWLFAETRTGGPRTLVLDPNGHRLESLDGQPGLVALPTRPGVYAVVVYAPTKSLKTETYRLAVVGRRQTITPAPVFQSDPTDTAWEVATLDLRDLGLEFARLHDLAIAARDDDDAITLEVPDGLTLRATKSSGELVSTVTGPTTTPFKMRLTGREPYTFTLYVKPDHLGSPTGLLRIRRPTRDALAEYTFELANLGQIDLGVGAVAQAEIVGGQPPSLLVVSPLQAVPQAPSQAMAYVVPAPVPVAGGQLGPVAIRPPASTGLAVRAIGSVPLAAGQIEPQLAGQTPDGTIALWTWSSARQQWTTQASLANPQLDPSERVLAVWGTDPPGLVLGRNPTTQANPAGPPSAPSLARLIARANGLEVLPVGHFPPLARPVGTTWSQQGGQTLGLLWGQDTANKLTLVACRFPAGELFDAPFPFPDDIRPGDVYAALGRWRRGQPAPDLMALVFGGARVDLLAYRSKLPGKAVSGYVRVITEMVPAAASRFSRVALHPTGRLMVAGGRAKFPLQFWTIDGDPASSSAQNRLVLNPLSVRGQNLPNDLAALLFDPTGQYLWAVDVKGVVGVWTITAHAR